MTAFEPVRFGKYLLLDKIATGGMAELYRAKITGVQGFEKLIAIKKILPHLAQEDELVECFIDEAKLAALLNHQNIVQIYDFGSLEGTYYIAMQYLFGKDLRGIVAKAEKSSTRIGLEYALYIVSRICAGLEYAHNLKDFQGKPMRLIHRDISPQNILITYEGDVKIVDFGIAKAAARSTLTQAGMIKGKVAYMSPEQAKGEAIDYRSDIFSTGILLYELTTGKRMFRGETMEILAKVRESRFEPPEKIIELPDKVSAVLHKALAKSPEERYQSCGEMLTDLEECIHELSLWPTSSGLGRIMRNLFQEEMAAEEKAIQRSGHIKTTIPEEPPQHRKPPAADRKADPPQPPPRQADKRSKNTMKLLVGGGGGLLVLIAVLLLLLLPNGEPPRSKTATSKEASERAPSPPESNGSQQEAGTKEKAALTESAAKSANETAPSGAVEDKVGTMSKVELEESEFEPGLSETAKAGSETESVKHPLIKLAVQASSEERYREAVDAFEEAFASDATLKDRFASQYAAALNALSQQIIKDDPEQAKALLSKSAAAVPDAASTHFQLGLLNVRMNHFPEAIAAYERAAELDPNAPDVFFNLGYAYAKTKGFEKAEAMYARTVELEPAYMDEALSNLAIVQHLLGKDEESAANLERALAINPENDLAERYLQRVRGALAEEG